MPVKHFDMQADMKMHLSQSTGTGAFDGQHGMSPAISSVVSAADISSVMTCIDGYAMAQKGRAGAALCIAAVGSFIAGTFGVVMLMDRPLRSVGRPPLEGQGQDWHTGLPAQRRP